MTALSNIEAKKRFEFLEAVSGTMDAHLRYFKQVCSCYCFHIDNSSLSTNVIQAHSTAIFFSGIRTTTSDGTIYQSSNSFSQDISFLVFSALVEYIV